MDSIQTKRILKKKKKILGIVNHIFSLDETIIKFSGDRNDLTFKFIELAFEDALSGITSLNQNILEMEGLSGRKFRILLNSLVRRINSPKYLEIGSWLGSTVCSACYENKIEAICIDNWSQNFLPEINPKDIFHKNIEKFISSKTKLKIIEENFRNVDFKSLGISNIFFYDGGHHYEDHFDSIKMALPALSKKFILIVDDWNWLQVRNGTLDAIKKEKLNVIAKLDIRTTKDNSSTLITGQNSDWHQGCVFFVIEK